MSNLLASTIEEYRARIGESEYRYFKKRIVWTKFRREPGGHVSPIGDGQEVTREEYEANVRESKRLGTEAFMGRWKASYWRYDCKLSKDGWREALIKDVQSVVFPS